MASATKLTTAAAGWTPIAEARGRMGLIEIDAYGTVQVAISEGRAPDGSVTGHAVTGQFRRVLRGKERVYVRGAGVQVISTLLAADDELAFSLDNAGIEALAKATAAQIAANEAKAALLAPYIPFASRAAAEAASIPPWFQHIQIGSLRYVRDAAGTALTTGDGGKWSPDGTPAMLEHFGNVGNGENDFAAMQTAINYAKSRGADLRGTFGKTYLCQAPLDAALPLGDTTKWSLDLTGCVLKQDFAGRDQIGLRFSVDGARAGGVARLRGARFENGPNAVANPPIMLDISGAANVHGDELHFAGTTNTQIRADSMYNNRLSRVTCYYGGMFLPYRVTTGVTFSTTAGSPAVGSSANHFTAADVGRNLTLTRADGRSEMIRVDAFVSPTEVTASKPLTTNYSGATGNWEHARITIAGTAATIVGEDWPANIEGQSIYVLGAGADGTLERLQIATRNSGATVTLAAAPTNNVTNARFAVPSVDIGSSAEYAGANTSLTETNYVTIDELFIENCRGVPLVVNDAANLWISNGKIHGEAQPNGNTAATSHHIWACQWQGGYEGTLEADNVSGAKVLNIANPGKLKFDNHLRAQLAINQKLVEHVSAATGGVVEIESVEAIGNVGVTTQIRDEALGSLGLTRIGSVSQAGSAPIYLPTRPHGLLTLNSDAQEFINYDWSEPPVIVDTTTLTAHRTRELSAVGAQVVGDVIRITRTGGGAFNLNVRDFTSSTTLKALVQNTWGDFAWNGTAWVLIGYGAL
ncbi:hypothetical protein [Paracoccus sp. SM22M-07]|uniref:hypothetical protein n=1 Tax=Paracoccus sp. SM22M-07 TaxID=1520813 RepID=UPI00091A74EA|nr:hypothetical protein [Paracoccus sp. SM22M-07]OJH45181.1 hypothetical protein IE00_05845 [Paracoccus sp. SM22M-07]